MKDFWKKEYRFACYSWEYEALVGFYGDILGLPCIYSWYSSPVDRGAKFPIGDCRIEIVGRRPLSQLGPSAVRLEAVDIRALYEKVTADPRTNVVRPLMEYPMRKEWRFALKDPAGDHVEIFQRMEDTAGPEGAGGFRENLTNILYTAQPDKMVAFYQNEMRFPYVGVWKDGQAEEHLFKAAGGWLEIRRAAPGTPAGPCYMVVETSCADEVFDAVIKKGSGTLVWDLENTWYGVRMFQLKDPDGNIVEPLAYQHSIFDPEADVTDD